MNNKAFHILVVDDDDRIRDLVKQYLEENNFFVTTANSAFDAKKKIYNALKNSDSDSVLKFKKVLNKIINE